MKAIIVYNPRSGWGAWNKETLKPFVIETLTQAGLEVTAVPTKHEGHAICLARGASKEGIDTIIAWGGDGTLNEVMQGVYGSSTRIGVLPGGTVNVFARETGIPLKLKPAISVIVAGKVRRIPVSLASGRPFILMAGLGLDGQIIHSIAPEMKRWGGTLALWGEGFRQLSTYTMRTFHVRWSEGEAEATGLIAGNLKRYGPHYYVTPSAQLEEPLIDVVMFRGTNKRDYFRYLLGVIGQCHLRFADVINLKTDRLAVEAEDCIPYQVDGERGGFTPLTIEVAPKRLNVLLP